ncbi:MAG: hypothetical protein NW224_20610 [Leptolyngbyaceae cyanobacterium bins.302]|nr:hypothetical protein [Leptolyngbyaceae cyanobacterium bins.302]
MRIKSVFVRLATVATLAVTILPAIAQTDYPPCLKNSVKASLYQATLHQVQSLIDQGQVVATRNAWTFLKIQACRQPNRNGITAEAIGFVNFDPSVREQRRKEFKAQARWP